MERVTINGTIAQFSCKQRISKDLWDAKGNRAKGKSRGAVAVNYALDNIKAQITKHYQRLSDREAFVTAEMYATPIKVSARSMKRYSVPLTRRTRRLPNGWEKTAPSALTKSI